MSNHTRRGALSCTIALLLATPSYLWPQSAPALSTASSRSAARTWPARSLSLVLKDDPADSTIAVVIRPSQFAPDEIVIGGAITDAREIALAFATWRSMVLGMPAVPHSDPIVLRTNLRPMGDASLISRRLAEWGAEARRAAAAREPQMDVRFGMVRRSSVSLPP